MTSSREPQDELVALRDLLQAVARELALMVALGERTQAAISPLLAGEGAFGATGAQGLDLLVQQAAGLGDFVSALGDGCPAGWALVPTAASEGLLMSAQRRRLASPFRLADSASLDPGGFELF